MRGLSLNEANTIIAATFAAAIIIILHMSDFA